MTKQPFHVAALALAVCSAAACTKKEPERSMTPASYTPPRSAPTQTPAAPAPLPSPKSQATPSTMTDGQRTARAIAAARCEREVRCENVGQEAEYVTEEDCMVTLEPDTQKELLAAECPGGYPAIELNECVEEIRAESCDIPLEDIARVAECRTTEICPD